jgi:hypothetical protein
MNVVALGLGVFLLALAVYTVSDPFSRARTWPAAEEFERDPRGAREKQRRTTGLYAYVCGLMGLLFVALGLAL